MNDKILIKVEGYPNKFIKKCIDHNIYLSNVDYKNEDILECLIDLKDLKTIKRLNYYSEIKIIKYNGLVGAKKHFHDYIYYYLICFLCFILMDVLTSYIVKIDVIHENSKIRELVNKELKNNNIYPFRLAYSFDELEKITKKILKDNPTSLEWLSITRDGMSYIVRAEERIITKNENEEGFRHIVSSKDAYITKIISTKGDVIVRSGDYVKKGTILISGEIKLYDTVKGNTRATGSVYGNVWYNADINMPKENSVEKYTGNERYNININDKIFLKNKYTLFKQENTKELKIFGFKIKIYKEKEYTIIKQKNTDKDALNKLISEFNLKLKGKGKIISQKVLKKDENNSTISYRVFIITNELISDYSYYTVGEGNDPQSSN